MSARQITEAHTFKIRLPESCEVLVYPSDEKPGHWVVKCHVRAVDVTDPNGAVADFSTTLPYGTTPTTDEVELVIRNMLAHEVKEQLGLDPHGVSP